jgi:hypothetical protein
MIPEIRASCILLLLSILAGCGAGSTTNSNNGNGNVTVPGSTSTQHVVVVVLENQDYSSIIGNSQMPFFNSLATQNALATQFYANTHPSIGNYFELTTGQNPTNNDDAWPGPYSGDNIARQLTAAGKTWKVYAESLPSASYTGGDVYPYIKHHNPFAYFTDVLNSTTQQANIVPFSQFTTDLNNNALPNFSLVVPNDEHNGHDCPDGTQLCLPSTKLATVDSWLSANIGGLVQNTSFMNNSVLIVTLDESLTDLTNGGGRIPVVLAGSSIKTGFQSTNTYQFPSLLRFSLNELGVTSIPGAGATAPSMGEFVK